MALSTIVSQRKQIKRKAPRGFLKRVFKRKKPQLRLEKSGDLLPIYSSFRPMFKAVPTMTGNVCSTLACQFIFLALSCTGPRRKNPWTEGLHSAVGSRWHGKVGELKFQAIELMGYRMFFRSLAFPR
ncbi:centromere protein W isoform X2 [Pongo pygmaeus]|uniref:centromere protein W isoform X2 n=1 Tax=Pongo pygmaeus TaxID=9600 RepID=UPI00300D47EF